MLDVNENDINQYGAVSEAVAEQMALSVKRLLDTDYAIGITGIAGPDGGTPDKPVGTTWISVAGRKKTVTRGFKLADNRERNTIRAARNAFMMFISLIKEEEELLS